MIHEAGRLIESVQRCARCGYILTDYRNTMVPDGTPPLYGWAVGEWVDVDEGNPRFSDVTEHPPTCEVTDVGAIE
jgi:hypothetical protein